MRERMTISGKEMVRLLKKEGWVVRNIEGSHYMMSKNGIKVSVPVHEGKDLAQGTFRKLLKETGLKIGK